MNMKNFRIRTTAVGAVALLAAAGQAWAEPDYDAVKAKLSSIVPPELPVVVSETPVGDFYQAQITTPRGPQFFYLTEDLTYFFVGDMFDLDSGVNLTQKARNDLRIEALEDLDVETGIRFAPENPEYELMVFTDINCGYCRKMHADITRYMDLGISITYFALPFRGQESWDMAEAVWCSADPQVALTRAKNGEEIEMLSCESPVEAQHQMGINLGVTGTPSMFLADGTNIPGYLPPEQLLQRLELVTGTAHLTQAD